MPADRSPELVGDLSHEAEDAEQTDEGEEGTGGGVCETGVIVRDCTPLHSTAAASRAYRTAR